MRALVGAELEAYFEVAARPEVRAAPTRCDPWDGDGVTIHLAEASDPDEVLTHQLGPIPVGLQLHFGLADLALHHDDVRAAVGEHRRPPPEVVDAIVDAVSAFGPPQVDGEAEGADLWAAILAGAGR